MYLESRIKASTRTVTLPNLSVTRPKELQERPPKPTTPGTCSRSSTVEQLEQGRSSIQPMGLQILLQQECIQHHTEDWNRTQGMEARTTSRLPPRLELVSHLPVQLPSHLCPHQQWVKNGDAKLGLPAVQSTGLKRSYIKAPLTAAIIVTTKPTAQSR